MSSYRVPATGLVDRSVLLSFVWHGRRLSGFRGDTLASALLANDVRLVGRSFKYHRPRGLLSAGLDEPNGIVQLETGPDAIPNLKATAVELYAGLKASAVNSFPSPAFDLMAINGLFKRFIPAAFYYKTFIWPSWHLFEPMIRRAAGLGRAPDRPDRDRYTQTHAHCERLVVGGGVSGLQAALVEARAGRRTILVSGGPILGGRLAGSDAMVEGRLAPQWIAAAIAELEQAPHVLLLRRTIATGYYDHNLLALCERLTDHQAIGERKGPRQRLWKIRADEVILATGAIERPIAFPGNDRPGVMLAGAARQYLDRYGVAVGRRIVVAANNDSAWHNAFALARAGLGIPTIADARNDVPPDLHAKARQHGMTVLLGHVPIATRGGRALSGVTLAPIATNGVIGEAHTSVACDTLLMSGGWNPAVHLHSQAGGKLEQDRTLHSFVPVETVQHHRSIGAAAGLFGIDACLASARGDAVAPSIRETIRPLWSVSPTGRQSDTAWVDFQNDVTAADLALAVRENFVSVEHLKRYTTLGMASDQGKTSNVTAIGIVADLLSKPMSDVGTTRFRPPYDPTTIGVFAAHRVGEGLQPRRRLAADYAHREANAAMEEYGGWMRPSTYRLAGESEAHAIAREVRAVRGGVGIFDASPLGKIEVKGPDAATFLDRIYVNTISSLKPGRCRYAVMLNENGIVYDDGIVTRLGDDHFLVGTTSGHASAVAEHLQEWLQCEWTGLRVLTEDVTSCWAVVTVAGPRARSLLQRLESDIDFSAAAFVHMRHIEGRITDQHCRIARVSFSGELSYEISVPWSGGERLWRALVAAGGGLGITPFGVESLMAMRIEKGFLHVGSDTDGMTLPQDIGFGSIVAKKPGDFIGHRSLERQDGRRQDRRQFVGLAVDTGAPLGVGAHVRLAGSAKSAGWVTSSTWSPTLGAPVALAMIEGGTRRLGEKVRVIDLGVERDARIVGPCRYDPEGTRLHD